MRIWAMGIVRRTIERQRRDWPQIADNVGYGSEDAFQAALQARNGTPTRCVAPGTIGARARMLPRPIGGQALCAFAHPTLASLDGAAHRLPRRRLGMCRNKRADHGGAERAARDRRARGEADGHVIHHAKTRAEEAAEMPTS